MVKFQSSRGNTPTSFQDILLNGLAPDGGLYSPLTLPELDFSSSANFQEIVCELILGFSDNWIEKSDLIKMIDESYAEFRDPVLCPIKNLDEQKYLLDLTLGPTLAFKDFALSLLARLLDYELLNRGETAVVLGATSGDTGSAAIHALASCDRVKTVMLHPEGKVSDVQRRQMTTVNSPKVHNFAVDGSFDDCQDLVKQAFRDENLRTDLNLVAINSINFARILIQIGYYFSAANQLSDKAVNGIDFVVPTGNFGNVLAGWYAKQLGAPINNLFVGSNHNNAFHEFLDSGRLVSNIVKPSLSPSMDIQIPSNLERLLWEASGRDSNAVAGLLTEFREVGEVSVPQAWVEFARSQFSAFTVSDEMVLEKMRSVYELNNIVVDPHTAVGLVAANELSGSELVVICETASPAKFPDAVDQALGFRSQLPEFMSDLFDLPEQFSQLDNSFKDLKHYLNSV